MLTILEIFGQTYPKIDLKSERLKEKNEQIKVNLSLIIGKRNRNIDVYV